MYKRMLGTFAAVAAASFMCTANAQVFPSKPITLVVPTAPGGPIDTTIRVIAPKVEKSLGQPIVVENRSGGNLKIAAQYVARSPGDGYVLFIGTTSNFSTAPYLDKDPGYSLSDFKVVTLVSKLGFSLVVSSKVPASNLKEFAEWAKSKKQGVNFGVTGLGTSAHVIGIAVADALQFNMTAVPYRGNAPLNADLSTGTVDFTIGGVRSGGEAEKHSKVLAVIDGERWPQMADVPTAAEAGFPQVPNASSWFGVMAPASTPDPIVQKLSAAFQEALAQDDTKQKLISFSQKPLAGYSPAAATAFIRQDNEQWGRIIKKAGLKPE